MIYPTEKRQTRKPAFVVGDFVRLKLQKGAFDRSFKQQFTEEIYKVSEIAIEQNVNTYRVVDLNDAKILGTFYANELKKMYFNEVQHECALYRILAKLVRQGVKQVKL